MTADQRLPEGTAFAEFFGEVGEPDFIRLRIVGNKKFTDGFQEGGTFLDLLLEPGGVGLGSGLFGEVGGFESDAIETIADFVDEGLKKNFKLLLGEVVWGVGT